MNKLLLALALCSCTAQDTHVPDVVGPFTGQVYRYAVDRITLPTTDAELRADGDDLDGDGYVDNNLGAVSEILADIGGLSASGPTLIGNGMIVSSLEILADDLNDDPTVQVTYYGSANDSPIPVTGRLIDGVFRSNRSFTTAIPGRTTAALPLFADADPAVVEIDGLELDLTPDGTGGFDVLVRGGIPYSSALAAAGSGVIQLIELNSSLYDLIGFELDTNRDGKLTADEAAASPFVAGYVLADLSLYDGGRYAPAVPMDGRAGDSESAGFAIHVVPCAAGSCATPTTDTCHDRILDGNETDLDCGGNCAPCFGGAQCSVGTDCQLGACDDGACRQATCDDEIQDGFETDVDCGDGCAGCRPGLKCIVDADCSAGICNSGRC